jgi:hypothetical protein
MQARVPTDVLVAMDPLTASRGLHQHQSLLYIRHASDGWHSRFGLSICFHHAARCFARRPLLPPYARASGSVQPAIAFALLVSPPDLATHRRSHRYDCVALV